MREKWQYGLYKMRLKAQLKKEKGFQFNSYIIEELTELPQEIQIYYFEGAYQNSFISHSEYFIQRIKDFPFTINYFVEGNNCWKIIDGGKILRIVIFEKKSYDKTIKLLKLLLEKYSLSLDNIVLNFEDNDFIRKIIKAAQ